MGSTALPLWPWAASPDLASGLLVSVRMMALWWLAPPVSSQSLPAMARASLVLLLSLAMWSVAPPMAIEASGMQWLEWAVLEFGKGALMAFGLHLAFAAFTAGARMLDVQVGFGIGQVLDPGTRQAHPVLGAAFALLAPVVFLTLDGHHLLLRAFAWGVHAFPPGTDWPMEATFQVVWQQLRALYPLGLGMVAPVVFGLVLVELALGVVARNLPQMNLFILGVPVKVLVGLALLAAWLGSTVLPVQRVFDSFFRGWEGLVQ